MDEIKKRSAGQPFTKFKKLNSKLASKLALYASNEPFSMSVSTKDGFRKIESQFSFDARALLSNPAGTFNAELNDKYKGWASHFDAFGYDKREALQKIVMNARNESLSFEVSQLFDAMILQGEPITDATLKDTVTRKLRDARIADKLVAEGGFFKEFKDSPRLKKMLEKTPFSELNRQELANVIEEDSRKKHGKRSPATYIPVQEKLNNKLNRALQKANLAEKFVYAHILAENVHYIKKSKTVTTDTYAELKEHYAKQRVDIINRIVAPYNSMAKHIFVSKYLTQNKSFLNEFVKSYIEDVAVEGRQLPDTSITNVTIERAGMSVANTSTRSRFIAQGLLNESFDLDFYFPDIEGVGLQAYLNGVLLEPNRYTFTRNADVTVFRIQDTLPDQLEDPPPLLRNGDVLIVRRTTRITQSLDFRIGSVIPASDIVDALDKQTLISQELKDILLQVESAPNYLRSAGEFPGNPREGELFHLAEEFGAFAPGVYIFTRDAWRPVGTGGGGGSGLGVQVVTVVPAIDPAGTGQMIYLTVLFEEPVSGTRFEPGLYINNGSSWALIETNGFDHPENAQKIADAIANLLLPNLSGTRFDVENNQLFLLREVGEDFNIRFPAGFPNNPRPSPEEARSFLQTEDGNFLLTEYNEIFRLGGYKPYAEN